MKRLYDYLMHPKRTVQLLNHQKDWSIWWLIVAISGLISSLKWTSISVSSFVFSTIIYLISIIFFSVLVDASGQLMGHRGQLKSIIYWLVFSSTITWLLPSLGIIQHSFISVGSLLILAINFIYGSYIWKTLKEIYKISSKHLIAILLMPLFLLVILFFSLGILLFQKVAFI